MTSTVKFRIETTGSGDSRRIMDGDAVIGMAERYTSGFWAPHALNGQRIGLAVHKTPAGVRKWFEESRP